MVRGREKKMEEGERVSQVEMEKKVWAKTERHTVDMKKLSWTHHEADRTRRDGP